MNPHVAESMDQHDAHNLLLAMPSLVLDEKVRNAGASLHENRQALLRRSFRCHAGGFVDGLKANIHTQKLPAARRALYHTPSKAKEFGSF